MPEEHKPIHPRKLKIVEAAVTCFLEKGYHQTGVRDIARQAGISLGNLYNHFKGKEAVLVFIAEIEGQELSDFIERLSNTEDPRAELERFVREYADYVALPENALLGVEILIEALRNPVIENVFGRNRDRLIAALSNCLTQGAKIDVFVSHLDSRVVACMILDAIEGQGLRDFSLPTKGALARSTISAFILNGLTQ